MNFDERRYVTPKDRPHVSRAVPLALAAVDEALVDAGIEPKSMPREDLRRVGVIVGSGGGRARHVNCPCRIVMVITAAFPCAYRLLVPAATRSCSVHLIR